MACDMIVASESAKFGQPEINLGVMPGAGGTQRLTRAVGKAVAMEVVLNGRTLTVDEAYRFGLVNRVVPVEQYLREALKLANEIAARAPLAVHLAKEAVNNAFESFLADGLPTSASVIFVQHRNQKEGEGLHQNARQSGGAVVYYRLYDSNGFSVCPPLPAPHRVRSASAISCSAYATSDSITTAALSHASLSAFGRVSGAARKRLSARSRGVQSGDGRSPIKH